MPAPFVHELRVRYGECDPQGIVFNANYLLYFDVVFTELWRAAVGPWQEMVERGIDAVVAEARVRFHAPARFDDELQLHARVTRLGSTSITTAIEVRRSDPPRPDGEPVLASNLLVEGELRHVCVATTPADGIGHPTKTEMPDWIREGLRSFAAESA